MNYLYRGCKKGYTICIIEDMTLNIVEWRKRIQVADPVFFFWIEGFVTVFVCIYCLYDVGDHMDTDDRGCMDMIWML